MVGNERSGNRTEHGSPRTNAQRVFIPTEMWLALDQLVSRRHIGRAAGILYCINETLFREGDYTRARLSTDDYNMLKERYLEPLIDKVKRNRAESETSLTKAQLTEQEDIKKWAKTFSNVAKQWKTAPEDTKKHYLKKARELIDKVPEAQKILDLCNQDKD